VTGHQRSIIGDLIPNKILAIYSPFSSDCNILALNFGRLKGEVRCMLCNPLLLPLEPFNSCQSGPTFTAFQCCGHMSVHVWIAVWLQPQPKASTSIGSRANKGSLEGTYSRPHVNHYCSACCLQHAGKRCNVEKKFLRCHAILA
jgi:hypothetical protein